MAEDSLLQLEAEEEGEFDQPEDEPETREKWETKMVSCK